MIWPRAAFSGGGVPAKQPTVAECQQRPCPSTLVEAASFSTQSQVPRPLVPVGGVLLLLLGVEVFGRWGRDVFWLVLVFARERAHGLLERVRLGILQRFLRRRWGLLGIATQRVVARAVSLGTAADLAETPLESIPGIADLA